MISLIACCDANNLIGIGPKIPWHHEPYKSELVEAVKADLEHFRKVTSGSSIIMGRTTFQSIGRPLPKRQNIVMTKGLIEFPGTETVRSWKEAMAVSRTSQTYVIGGGQVYNESIAFAERIILTRLDIAIDVESTEKPVYFPAVLRFKWTLVETQYIPKGKILVYSRISD